AGTFPPAGRPRADWAKAAVARIRATMLTPSAALARFCPLVDLVPAAACASPVVVVTEEVVVVAPEAGVVAGVVAAAGGTAVPSTSTSSVLPPAKLIVTFQARVPGWSAPSISKPHCSKCSGFTAPPDQVMWSSVR